MKVLLFVVACAALVLAADPSPPTLSESFTSFITITIKDSKGTHNGRGIWTIDQPGNMGLEKYDFDSGNTYNIFNLQRYDMGASYSYDINSANKTDCHGRKVTGAMPKVWDWVSMAKYAGQQNSMDLWNLSMGYATLTLAVKTSDTTTPVYLIRNARDEIETTYMFTTWNTTTPSANFFTVPPQCKMSRTEAIKSPQCVSGATAIARAKVWVAAHVPYNQGGTYQGYREDCSGYVSMCWESSQPGHTTFTMNQIAHEISKDDLAPGDCLLWAAEHVVLFGGWLNSDKSQYQAYEETRPGEGTVTRATPYPYWYSQSDFIPFRYNDIC